jgi:ribosomal protein S18 acetylase RimI-like enzyme
MVFTHGDAPGNVLVKSPDDIYIIDWDELSLAPPERDMWMIDHLPEFMDGYKSILPEFFLDSDMRNFCVLKYYFQRNMHYFFEILKETATSKERLKQVEKFDYELKEGWMKPKLAQVWKGRKMSENYLVIRKFREDDIATIQAIRRKAFRPIYEGSWRNIVGEAIFNLEYSNWDKEQGDYLLSICAPDSGYDVYVVTNQEKIIGFIALSLNPQSGKGEIDLNAIDPDSQGQGAGQFMYRFAIAKMKEAGIKFVKVSTGGDPSHALARGAYEKAGFGPSIPSVTYFQMI